MEEDKEFLRQDSDYRTLKAFQKAECIYDVTYFFAHKFLKTGDRTIDQMVQAARSGKQNLAEGTVDGVTSKEMGMKLTNVNRASLHELLLDYEDYLRVRGLKKWAFDDPRCVQTRAFCKVHQDSAVYREKIKERSDETIANIAITLIHQCDVLLRGLIEWQKREFLAKGGIKEEMYRARKDWQRRNGYYGGGGYNRSNRFDGSNRSDRSNRSDGSDRSNRSDRSDGEQPIEPNQPIKPTQPINPNNNNTKQQ